MVQVNHMPEKIEAIDELITSFLTATDLKPKSKETYRKALKQFSLFITRSGSIAPTREDIITFKHECSVAGRTATTINLYIIVVRQFFIWLEKSNRYPNVAKGIKGTRAPKGFKKDTLTIEQIRRTLQQINRHSLEGKRDYAIINLLIRTGLRTIELHRANIGDIRQEAGEALLYIQGKGSDSKDAFAVLTEDALQPIREYIAARNEKSTHKPLFASHSLRNEGDRLSTQTISKAVKRALRAVGLDDSRLTAHSLRHTAITLSLIGGASVQEAQIMARHASINTTLVYAQNIKRIQQAPEKRIDRLLNARYDS